jgi:nicotinate-nucleotide adenylyltransferase
MNIGLFCGSFNPPHLGHLKIGEMLIKNKYIDQIWYVPNYQSLDNKDLIDPQHRINMLKELKLENSFVCTYEIDNKMSGSSYEFVSSLLSTYYKTHPKSDRFYFIAGMDVALRIKEFKKYNELIDHIPFIILKRKEITEDGFDKFSISWFYEDPHKFAYNVEVPMVSSSEIRNAIKNIKIKGLDKKFFSKCNFNVFKYALNNNLYVEDSYVFR